MGNSQLNKCDCRTEEEKISQILLKNFRKIKDKKVVYATKNYFFKALNNRFTNRLELVRYNKIQISKIIKIQAWWNGCYVRNKRKMKNNLTRSLIYYAKPKRFQTMQNTVSLSKYVKYLKLSDGTIDRKSVV